MNNLQIFSFEEKDVRTQVINNEPWFVGKDVADILGYRDTSDALKKHVDEEDKLTRQITDSGQGRQMYVINESGLYSLILKSKMTNARQFKRWVTSEVLPTIRKYGVYMSAETIEKALTDPDTIIHLATQLKKEREILKEEREQKLIAQQQVMELQPKADYYDSILSNKGLIPITTIAKNYGMSGTKFNELLHEMGIQYKQGKTWLLYQKHAQNGYTHSEPFAYVDKEGNDQVTMNTKWTQKGHLFIYETLKGNGILPLIEQRERK